MLAVGAADAALAPAGVEAVDRLEVEAVDVGLAEEQLGPRPLDETVVVGEERGGEAVPARVEGEGVT